MPDLSDAHAYPFSGSSLPYSSDTVRTDPDASYINAADADKTQLALRYCLHPLPILPMPPAYTPDQMYSPHGYQNPSPDTAWYSHQSAVSPRPPASSAWSVYWLCSLPETPLPHAPCEMDAPENETDCHWPLSGSFRRNTYPPVSLPESAPASPACPDARCRHCPEMRSVHHPSVPRRNFSHNRRRDYLHISDTSLSDHWSHRIILLSHPSKHHPLPALRYSDRSAQAHCPRRPTAFLFYYM